MTTKTKIGVIGLGTVGLALVKHFDSKGVDLYVYDNKKKMGSIEEINLASIIFICVPTPYTKKVGFCLKEIENACKVISGKKIVVIKSTVIPETTNKLQKKYPQHKFIFNPEFLSNETAEEDMVNPDRQILGFTEESKNEVKRVMDILPRAPHEITITATEAEMVKYFNNTFNAVKVVFANQMYDLCQNSGANYDIVMSAASKSKFIGSEDHLEIYHKGYRGYGGKCLVKDIRSLIDYAERKGVDLELHKTVEKINNKLKKGSNLGKQQSFYKKSS